jgi:N6-adenosine-specific RNA methylase IME4
MSVAEIQALPVVDMAEDDAHLYLWTINRYVEAAYTVARAWGFVPSTLLTWCKQPRGIGLGGAFTLSNEHVLFCRRGKLPAKQRVDRNWWLWRRTDGVGHSGKPEAFIDMVEQVSPDPYVELFARRHRLGWDVWGNESANTTQLEVSA